MVDYIADYIEGVEKRQVLSTVHPGYLKELVPDHAPEEPESFENIMADIERVIMPGVCLRACVRVWTLVGAYVCVRVFVCVCGCSRVRAGVCACARGSLFSCGLCMRVRACACVSGRVAYTCAHRPVSAPLLALALGGVRVPALWLICSCEFSDGGARVERRITVCTTDSLTKTTQVTHWES